MRTAKELGQILFVAVVIGATLAAIFLPLMSFERAMGDQKQYNIWVAEWVFFDLLLTFVLCRQEIFSLIRRKPSPPGRGL
jgi:hypothetical protein